MISFIHYDITLDHYIEQLQYYSIRVLDTRGISKWCKIHGCPFLLYGITKPYKVYTLVYNELVDRSC